MKGNNNYKLRLTVMAIPTLIFLTMIIIGFIDSNTFTSLLWGLFEKIMINLGWLVSLTTLFFCIVLFVLWIHPIGNIKFGGPNAKPKYSKWNWWCMSLCAGISTGILFWGVSEPLTHVSNPAVGTGLEAGSNDAIIWALSSAFTNWTIMPYAIICVTGLVLAYSYYNLNKPYCVSSGMTPLLGDKALGSKTSTIIDALTLFSITGGVAGSLGFGMLQIGDALQQIVGIKSSPTVWIIIAICIVTSYCISSYTGLDKGIKWLSDKNASIFIFLLVFALIFGPTAYILNLSTQATGSYLNNFFTHMTFTSPNSGSDLWPQWWTMYCGVDWIAFAPIIGLFLVKLCYGRTIKEFITVNLFFPALFGLVWFSVFGGLGFYLQYNQGVDLIGYMNTYGVESMLLKVLEYLPLHQIMQPLLILLICLSFVTLADSMTSTVSLMSIKSNDNIEEAPLYIKLFWGILMGVTSVIFLMNGGLEGIKVVKTLAGIPTMFIILLMVLGFISHVNKKAKENNTSVEVPLAITSSKDND